jgi:hypothetical protein
VEYGGYRVVSAAHTAEVEVIIALAVAHMAEVEVRSVVAVAHMA